MAYFAAVPTGDVDLGTDADTLRYICAKNFKEADSLYRSWLGEIKVDDKVDVTLARLPTGVGVYGVDQCRMKISSFNAEGLVQFSECE